MVLRLKLTPYRALLQVQPDIIVAKLSQRTMSVAPLQVEALAPRCLSTLPVDNKATGTATTVAAPCERYDQSWSLRNVFGTIQYSRNHHSITRRRHRDDNSKKQELEVIIAQYRGPWWLVNQVWRIQAVKASYGWKFCPRTYNVIPRSSPVLECIRTNNVEGLQSLFTKREASFDDCDEYDFMPLAVGSSSHHVEEQRNARFDRSQLLMVSMTSVIF